MRMFRSLFAVGWLLVVGVSAVSADPVGDFYKGKVLTFALGSEAGTGYEIHTRILSRHITAHIPGNPTAIVQEMPGASSIRAANYVYNVAPKDGTSIGVVQRTMLTAKLARLDGFALALDRGEGDPTDYAKALRLRPALRAILSALCAVWGEQGWERLVVWPSNEHLCGMTGLSERALRYGLRDLVAERAL